MSCGYSSGWMSTAFGFPVATVELQCKVKGDPSCLFISASTYKIEFFVEIYSKKLGIDKSTLIIPKYLEIQKSSRYSIHNQPKVKKKFEDRLFFS
jgi:hypothetical protein